MEKEMKNEKSKKKVFFTEGRIELITAIFLGITALTTAWATWIGSLHGGNQATNYTMSNNLASEGNSMYNEAAQYVMSDLMIWNDINDLSIEYTFALENGDETTAEKCEWKLEQIMTDNCTDEFLEAINWALDQEEYVTPFEYQYEDGTYYLDTYYADALDTLAEAEDLLEQGKLDNAHGDAFGLVTVIYSIVLFLLGIVGIFKNIPNRKLVLIIAIVAFLVATIYMFTIPMPTGFNFASYFQN